MGKFYFGDDQITYLRAFLAAGCGIIYLVGTDNHSKKRMYLHILSFLIYRGQPLFIILFLHICKCKLNAQKDISCSCNSVSPEIKKTTVDQFAGEQ